MRAVVQRVSRAQVTVDGVVVAGIGPGLLVYLAVGGDDESPDMEYVVDKVRHLRVFADQAGKLNVDVVGAGGEVLAVSAFTVYADARKGRRPCLDAAATAEKARELFERFCEMLSGRGVPVRQGVFGAKMQVESVNSGPICLLLDSKRGF